MDLAGGAADLCAVALYWPETGLLRAWAIMPEARVHAAEIEDRAPYRRWEAEGLLVTMPGRALDRVWLGNWLAAACEGLDLVAIATDRWMLASLQQDLDREGITLPLEAHGQGFKDMTGSIGALETAVLNTRLRTGGNGLLRWCVANASVEGDPAGNRKLSKLRSRGRIDPLVASVMAIGLASRMPQPPQWIFGAMAV